MPGRVRAISELLDIYDATNTQHLGIKPRDEVHRDGDWHRCFHLWIVSDQGVLLQRRALDKGTFANMLDATAAGHLTAGEDIADGVREVQEELGISYAFTALTALGVWSIEDSPRPDRLNREHQYVYAIRDDRPLDAYTELDRVELDGLAIVSFRDFKVLVSGAGDVAAREFDGRTHERTTMVTAAELVPARYLEQITGPLHALGVR